MATLVHEMCVSLYRGLSYCVLYFGVSFIGGSTVYLSSFGEVAPPLSQFMCVLLVSLLQFVVFVLCQHHLLLVLE